MTKLINGYKQSCALVKGRIKELTEQRSLLKRQGQEEKIGDLEQRIRLLYTEHSQMQEIIAHLTAYRKRVEQRVET